MFKRKQLAADVREGTSQGGPFRRRLPPARLVPGRRTGDRRGCREPRPRPAAPRSTAARSPPSRRPSPPSGASPGRTGVRTQDQQHDSDGELGAAGSPAQRITVRPQPACPHGQWGSARSLSYHRNQPVSSHRGRPRTGLALGFGYGPGGLPGHPHQDPWLASALPPGPAPPFARCERTRPRPDAAQSAGSHLWSASHPFPRPRRALTHPAPPAMPTTASRSLPTHPSSDSY